MALEHKAFSRQVPFLSAIMYEMASCKSFESHPRIICRTSSRRPQAAWSLRTYGPALAFTDLTILTLRDQEERVMLTCQRPPVSGEEEHHTPRVSLFLAFFLSLSRRPCLFTPQRVSFFSGFLSFPFASVLVHPSRTALLYSYGIEEECWNVSKSRYPYSYTRDHGLHRVTYARSLFPLSPHTLQ